MNKNSNMEIHRAKRDMGKWVYGYYLGENRIMDMQNENLYDIIPETLGKFVSIICKKEVWENDIVQFREPKKMPFEKNKLQIGVIKWDKETLMWRICDMQENIEGSLSLGWVKRYEKVKVIGNKFDNPELFQENTIMTKEEFLLKNTIEHFNNEFSGMIKRHEKEMQELLQNFNNEIKE